MHKENIMSIEPNENVIRGLKAKLMYESCDLRCTPADKCTCEQVLEDISAANDWINSLPGDAIVCEDVQEECNG